MYRNVIFFSDHTFWSRFPPKREIFLKNQAVCPSSASPVPETLHLPPSLPPELLQSNEGQRWLATSC